MAHLIGKALCPIARELQRRGQEVGDTWRLEELGGLGFSEQFGGEYPGEYCMKIAGLLDDISYLEPQ